MLYEEKVTLLSIQIFVNAGTKLANISRLATISLKKYTP